MAKKSAGRATTKSKTKQFSLMEHLLTPLYLAKDKGLAAGKVAKLDAEQVKKAILDGLVAEKAEKKGKKFFLTVSGEKYYVEHLPIEHKLQEIAVRQSNLQKSLAALRQELSELCAYSNAERMPAELAQALSEVRQTWEEGHTSLANKLLKVQEIAEVAQLGQKYLACLEAAKDKVEAWRREANKANEENQEEYRKYCAAWEARMQAWQEQLQALSELAAGAKPAAGSAGIAVAAPQSPPTTVPCIQQRAVSQAFDFTVAEAPAAVAPSVAATPKPRAGALPDEKAVVAALERGYHSLVAANPCSGGVDFPALYQKVKEEFPGLPIPQYKEILSKLCDACVIDLQSVTDRSRLKQPEFSIPTSLGDLYYVVWR